MNYVDVFYQSDDGLRLYARDYPGPARDAPVILCLPGLTRNSKDFAPLAEKIADRVSRNLPGPAWPWPLGPRCRSSSLPS